MKKELDKQIPIQTVKNLEMTRSRFMRFSLYSIPFQLFQIKCAVENLEAVQKRVTKMIKVLTNIPSEERVRKRVYLAWWKDAELMPLFLYMKKCVSDRSQIPFFPMSQEQEESY